MKWGALANPGARRRPAEATLSGIAADKAAGTAYEIINQSINQSAPPALCQKITPFEAHPKFGNQNSQFSMPSIDITRNSFGLILEAEGIVGIIGKQLSACYPASCVASCVDVLQTCPKTLYLTCWGRSTAIDEIHLSPIL